MSDADPFNFGPPNEFRPPPGGHPAPGGQGNPFSGSVPDNPLSAPSAGHPSSANSANGVGYAGAPGRADIAGPGGQLTSPFGDVAGAPGQQSSAGPPGQAPTQAMFGGAISAESDLVAAKPPTWLLFLAGGLALIAGVVAIVVANPIVAIVCWLVAGPVAIGLLAWFVVKDTFARSSGLYAAPDWVQPLHYVAIGVCLICILAPALSIANWVGRL